MNELVRHRVLVILSIAALTAAAVKAQDAPREPKSAEQIVPLVNQYCGACHAVPRPDVLPKRSWPAVIRTMVEIAQRRIGRAGISEQQMHDMIALYYGSSPEDLPALPYIEERSPTRRFVSHDAGSRSQLPFVTNVNATKVTKGADVELLVCDGEAKKLLLLTKTEEAWRETPLADIDIPVRTHVVDIDADDDADILELLDRSAPAGTGLVRK